jgi:hypothetical protein
MENVENLWRGRFTTFPTPLGKPALAGEQVSHIDHITTTVFFPDGTGKKDGSYRMIERKIQKENEDALCHDSFC